MKEIRFEETGGDIRDVLHFLEKAYRNGRSARVPASALPLLSRVGWRPDSTGDYLFPLPRMSKVAVCPFFERLLALVALVILSPLFLLVAFWIVLDDGSPVFFVQTRSGLRAHPFRIVKFRTMVRDSLAYQRELMRKAKQQDRVFKLPADPRVTRAGVFLRRCFLDELPQLVNVVKGEMRFAGPRPLPAYDHGQYHRSDQALRLLAVPGITGIWQVSGRNRLTFDEMCLLDYYGICHTSFLFTCKILRRTVKTALGE